MKKETFVTALLLSSFIYAGAQENLVPNGDFEIVDKKIKESGAIDLATGWTSATTAKVDLFSSNAKLEDYGVPKNAYAEADALSGTSYAGVRMYSYKDADPRTYLQAKLTSSLDAGKLYCVKFNVRLADMAKYASNNLGVYLSSGAVSETEIMEYNLEPQVKHSQNRIFNEQFDWETICQIYKAEGGEKYITIGNFAHTDDTQNEKMKRPKGTTGTQTRDAYYFIDDVSVMNMAGVEECDCERDAAGKTLVVQYTSNVSTEIEAKDFDKINLTKIYFEETSSNLTSTALTDLEKVAGLMKENPNYTMVILGHTDKVEELKITGNVAQERADAVKSKLVELGVEESRMSVAAMKDAMPATQDATAAGQAQNRRVEFKVSVGQ